MKTHQLTDLSSQIEQLIHDHMAAHRKAAKEALARAFDAATALSAPKLKQSTYLRASAVEAGRKPRRKRAEIQELSERIYQAVAANPGETMAFLAGKLGGRVRDLQRPMDILRQAKRIRTAGQRHLTRYFPMCDGEAVAA